MHAFIFLVQLLSVLCLVPGQSKADTELWIRPQDETGRTIRLTRAEVYLDIWGHGQNVALAQTERGVRLPLDRDWPCTAWPDICGKQILWGARLILQADGFAPVTSRTFLPIGAENAAGRPAGTSADTVSIEFDGIAPVQLREGESREVVVAFRRPAPRTLRIVDERGAGLPGVDVVDKLLFARSNHCGAMEGEVLASGKTDAAGEVRIPDVNGECAFEMENLRHYALRESPFAEVPLLAVREPRSQVTTIVLRALKKEMLRLEFRIAGIPAAGMRLISCLSHCCGACCGTVEGETAPDGRVVVKDFYAEEYHLILQEGEDKTIWQGNPPAPDASGWSRIEISRK